MSEIQAHLAQRFDSVEVQEDPFPHIYIDQIFPPTIYEDMHASLPSAQYIERCEPNDVTDPSRVFDLLAARRGNGLDELAEHWQGHFRPIIDALDNLLVAKFRPQIDVYLDRMGWKDGSVVRGQSLFCFRPNGWHIPPHTHQLTQLLQTMIYFPSDGYRRQQGTYFYKLPWYRRPSVEKQRAGTVRYRFVRRSTLIPFAHNSLVSWINTPSAIHGTVDRSGDPPRRYIFLAHTHAAA